MGKEKLSISGGMTMGDRLRIFLNREEDRTPFELRTATTVPVHIKNRAEALRWSVRAAGLPLNLPE
jgi:hypothetical protein